MKQRTIETIKDILITEMNHWAFLPVFITLICVTAEFTGDGQLDFLLWVLCGLFPVGFYFLRTKATGFIPFVLTHFLLSALVLFIPARTIVSKSAGIALVLIYFGHSFYLRLKNDVVSGNVHPVVAAVIAAICLFLLHYLNITSWDSVCLLGLAGVFFLYFIIYYMDHYLEFLSFNESSTGYLPKAEMFRSGMGFVLAYTLIGTVLLLLSTNVAWLETILGVLKNGIIAILRFLFSLFPGKAEAPEIIQQEEPLPPSGQGMELPEGREPSVIWQILEAIVLLALVCGLLFLMFRLLIWLVRFVRSRFALGYSRQEQHFEDIQDQREKCDPVRKKAGAGKSLFHSFSPGERIRRRYKKKIISCRESLFPDNPDDKSVLGLLTARECGVRLESMDMIPSMDMVSIYEKVRYTEEPVTEEMVRNMRQACK